MRVRHPPRVDQSDHMIHRQAQTSRPSRPGPHLLRGEEQEAHEAPVLMEM